MRSKSDLQSVVMMSLFLEVDLFHEVWVRCGIVIRFSLRKEVSLQTLEANA